MARTPNTKIKSSTARVADDVSPPVAPARTKTKAAAIIALLKSKRGATIQELMQATNWQAHSIRGFLAGSLSKRHGLAVTSDKPEGKERRYRVQ
jgi:hypothetical protein